ncbi:hypothetical protein [uncultured Thiodictyon sp.]|uniref:hypothetical protein n=1 Tax=uncultured Thiodictyon sp. TaxID=1846217 RepID=UPI0025F8F769|nr:hypothetical protein [uncultured Thiodictyon sp.]
MQPFIDLAKTIAVAAMATSALVASAGQAAYTENYINPTQGWKIMQPDYNSNTWLDAISFEWDYYMIHSDTFNGIVGYVLANPHHKAAWLDWALLPGGNNIGIVGELPGRKPIANYINFGIDNTSINGSLRAMQATGPNGSYANYQALPDGGPGGVPAMQLKGRTTDFEWSFLVTQDLQDRDVQRPITGAFTTAYGNDVGAVSGDEQWNVDMGWPRTNVVGWVKVLKTGELVQVNGKGYREDSFGRYALSLDGWDFAVWGDTDPHGVLASFQTYHKSKDMDNLDVSFYDNGQLQSLRFAAKDGELGWDHPNWKWDGDARSCVPTNTRIRGKKGNYRIDATVDIGDRQTPMLSGQTIGTSIFFIQEHFTTVTGTIKRADGTLVTPFNTRGGGEFARTRDIAPWYPNLWCNLWGETNHQSPMPF